MSDAFARTCVRAFAAACLFLFWQAFVEHWLVFVGWTILGQLIYFGYGIRHSRLNKASADKA